MTLVIFLIWSRISVLARRNPHNPFRTCRLWQWWRCWVSSYWGAWNRYAWCRRDYQEDSWYRWFEPRISFHRCAHLFRFFGIRINFAWLDRFDWSRICTGNGYPRNWRMVYARVACYNPRSGWPVYRFCRPRRSCSSLWYERWAYYHGRCRCQLNFFWICRIQVVWLSSQVLFEVLSVMTKTPLGKAVPKNWMIHLFPKTNCTSFVSSWIFSQMILSSYWDCARKCKYQVYGKWQLLSEYLVAD